MVAAESRLAAYWLAWIVALSIAVTLRVFVFDDTDDRFALVVSYMLGTWVPMMGLNMYEGQRLMSYLREHHVAKWEELTYVPGFGSGGMNGFRTLPWLYSADTLGDAEVARLKHEHRSFLRFLLTVFCSYTVVVPLLAF